jgi:hypothetical protein
LVIAVGCGGGGDEAEGGSDTSEKPSTSSGGSASNSEDNSPPQESEFVSNDDLDCSLISGTAGIPVAALSAFISTTPDSDLSRQVWSYFEELLEETLDIEATATCFFEATVDEEGSGIWIAFSLSEDVDAPAVSALTRELASRQVEVDASGDVAKFLGSLSVVALEQVPGAPEGTRGAVMLSGDTALVLAGSDFEDTDPTPSPATGGPQLNETASSGNSDPLLDPIFSISGELEGEAATVTDALISELEQEIGVILMVDSAFSAVEGTSVNVIAGYTSSSEFDDDVADLVDGVIGGFGGSVDAAFSFDGTSSISFTGAIIAGQSVSGVITTNENQLSMIIDVSPA